MALKNKYQRQKQQYSNDGGTTWIDVSPANYRRGRLLEEASEDCNTIEWREVLGSWFCVTDTYATRWITDSSQYECVGYNKYSVEKEQSTVDGGLNWSDTGNTRRGTLIETNSTDCGYNAQYRWVNVSDDYECDGTTKYNKEKEQVSTDDGVTWTDTGNTRRGNVVIERYSIDCGYVPLNRWVLVDDDYYCVGNDKYEMDKKQVSMDNGITWEDVVPLTYRQGAIIEKNSEDCMIYEKYLTTQMLSSGAIGIENNGESALTNIAYSKNDGEWTPISYGQYVNVVNGDIIRWKANGYQTTNTGGTGQMYTTAYSYSYYSYFNSTADFNAYGNPKSLLYSDDFATFNETYTNPNGSVYVRFLGLFREAEHLINAKRLAMPSNLATNNALEYMFYGCTSLITAPELPATSVGIRSYGYMFQNCTSLTNAPSILPSIYSNTDVYESMFEGCTSLVTAPLMNVTRISNGGCSAMFKGCTSLVNTPQINATYVGYEGCYEMFKGCTSLTSVSFDFSAEMVSTGHCYYSMFEGCTSLVTAPQLTATTLATDCYNKMFKDCTSLRNAPQLPATTLSVGCYRYMFQGCTSLVNAPELPATTLADYCYQGMFKDCTSLANAPQLPATILAINCYNYMFQGCTNLTTAPVLPATTLTGDCYAWMFQGCTNLTTAPSILPATTLVYRCYDSMFQGCTSLTTAPELPATTLVSSCYNSMFYNCSSLNYVKAMFTSKPFSKNVGPGTTYAWLLGVSETGTFVKNSEATWTDRGTNSIPTGWTVETASE